MKPMCIGIAGGSGAGKSTLCMALIDRYPDTIGCIQLDDYFKAPSDVPRLNGHLNYDHPDALLFDKLVEDLTELTEGKPFVIQTKNARLNPEFKHTRKRIPVEFHPKPIILVEGYLVLFDERVRSFFSRSVWLEANHETRWERRVHFKNQSYEQQVQLPMHAQFAEPTKQYASLLIDVSSLSKEEVVKRVDGMIQDVVL